MPEKYPLRWIGGLVALVAVGWCVCYVRSCSASHHSAALAAQSQMQEIAAAVQAAKGSVYDQQVQAQDSAVQSDAQEVARLRAEVARLRNRPAAPPADPSQPAAPQPDPQPVDLPPVVAAQDALIAAQDQQIKDQGAQIQALTKARDAYKSAWESSERAAALANAAHQAQVAALKAERWKGRIEGLAVGLGGGYLAGRVLR